VVLLFYSVFYRLIAVMSGDTTRRGGEDTEERGPGAAHHMFVVMEDLLEKLKILDYEEEVLAKHNMKAISR